MDPNLSFHSPYILFADVQVRYSDEAQGLRGVTLSIYRGDFVFLLGTTGAGKSTLLKCLTREVPIDKGKVLLHGRDISSYKKKEIPLLRREMGIVPQDFSLLPHKNVYENVAYAMRAAGHTKAEVRKKVPEILERCQIGHKISCQPHQLSGGEKQRVAIARALINAPALLIADEPTANLDFDRAVEIMELLKFLNGKGTTILVATHDMRIVERLGRRIVRLKDGLLESDESPKGAAVVEVPDGVTHV